MPPEPMPPPAVWARPPFVLSAILLYLAVHFAVRLAMWHTLGLDDAEQALFAQEFAWNYRFRAPPLFTWLLIGLGKAMGINIVSISVIRYALLGVTYVFAYLTARRLIADPRLAALSVYSFAAIYVFAFYSHHDLTHTTLMSAMLAAAWYVFVRLAESPAPGWYVALGVVFGLGFLGKWNFAMFAAALPVACVIRPACRALILTWKVVPALAVCALIVLPTVTAIILADSESQDMLQSVLVGDAAPYLDRVVAGILRLGGSVLAYPEPFLPLAVLFFALPLWRGLKHPAALPSQARAMCLDPAFVGWTIAVSLALHLALVLALGAQEISERLMQPPLFILPIFLFMLVERGRPALLAVNAFAAALALLVAGTLAARVVVYLRGADHCGTCRNMMPVEALADQLESAGFSGAGTILAGGFHLGGNMRMTFPGARVIDVDYPVSVWPEPRGTGSCLVVWNAGDGGAESTAAEDYVSAYLPKLGGDPDASHREGVVSALMYGTKTRYYRLGYRLYPEPVGDCR